MLFGYRGSGKEERKASIQLVYNLSDLKRGKVQQFFSL